MNAVSRIALAGRRDDRLAGPLRFLAEPPARRKKPLRPPHLPMPEGHKTHRLAIDHTDWLSGQVLKVTSPQGRFRSDARKVNGVALKRVDAIGKHLFYRFENDRIVHIHLGRYGSFRRETSPPPKPIGQIRMRMIASDLSMDLRGPTRCEVIDEQRRQEVASSLGPDPLAGGRAVDVWNALRESRKPIATLLLDQSIVAGIGNIFRAEMLFEAEINPELAGCDLDRGTFDRLWKIVRKQMRTGLKYGKIVTVTAREAGQRIADVEGKDRFRVYGHTQCPRCNGPITMADIASRKMYWCPRCQA